MKNVPLHSTTLTQSSQFNQNSLSRPDSLGLRQRNQNMHNIMSSTTYKSNSKRNQLNKKAFLMKTSKNKLNLFDPSSFKAEPLTGCLQISNQSKLSSNFELLKKEIEYLQQDELDCDKFPKRETLLDKMKATFYKHQRVKTTQINFQSNNKKYKNIPKPIGEPYFTSTFTRKSFATPIKDRISSEQSKYSQKRFMSCKKRSDRKHSMICSNQTEEKQNINRAPHNKFILIAPFRKYFKANGSRHSQSCTMNVDNIFGKKLNRLLNFTLQDMI